MGGSVLPMYLEGWEVMRERQGGHDVALWVSHHHLHGMNVYIVRMNV